jgi:hypothetical protein
MYFAALVSLGDVDDLVEEQRSGGHSGSRGYADRAILVRLRRGGCAGVAAR